MKTVATIFSVLVVALFANAEMTYSGKIKDASNNPLNGSYTVIATVRNAANSCTLYTETFSSTNFDGTNGGAFTIAFGAGSLSGGSPTIEKVLDTNFTPNPTTGTSYQSCTAGVKRFMYLQVGASAIYGPIPLTASPSSLAADRAKQVGDLAPANILQLQNGVTQTPLSAAQYDNFVTLLSGVGGLSNNQVMSWNGTSWSGITPLTAETDPSVKAFAKANAPTCTGGQFLTSDGTNLSCGTPTSGLSAANATTSGYLVSSDYTSFSNKMDKTLSSGNIWVGNGSNVATSVSLSGDVAISNVGVTTINSNSVTSAKIVDGTITGADLSGSINISTSGSVGSNSVSTRTLAISNASNNTLSLTVPAATFTNYALTLPSSDGTSGQVLSTNGSGQLVWSAAGAGGSVTSVSASAPLSSSGGTSPNISLAKATASNDGYLASSDFATFSNKQDKSLNSAKIWVGNGSNVATAVAPSGDVAMDNAGTFTISNGSVGLPKMGSIATNSIIGRWAGGTGVPQTINIGSGLTLSSGTLSSTGLSNFTESVNSSAPNATVPYVAVTPNNAATDVDVAIRPKGAGALTMDIADGTSTGGDKRGTGSIDLQVVRSSSTQVASGSSAAIIGGWYNTASGNYTGVFAGRSNTASASFATIVGGEQNTASGSYAAVVGGYQSSALGNFSFAAGKNITADSYGQVTVGNYNMPKGSESTSAWVTSDPLFVVGNGTGSGAARSTALMVLKNGSVGIGTTSPTAKFAVSGDATIGKITAANGGAKLDVAGAIVMSGSTSGYVGFQPSAAAGSTVWTLPSTDGSPGYVLKTDGAGTLGWAALGGGGTVTNVSVGTGPLSISSPTTTPTISIAKATAGNDGYLSSGDWSTFNNKLANNVSGNNKLLGRYTAGAGSVEELSLGTGLTVSSGTLTVFGNGSGQTFLTHGGNTLGSSVSVGTSDAFPLYLQSYNANRVRIEPFTGNVGIGYVASTVNNPLAVSGDVSIGKNTVANGRLDVMGSIVMSGSTSGYNGFKVSPVAGSAVWTLPSQDGSPGYVLKTDGAGNLSWIGQASGLTNFTEALDSSGLNATVPYVSLTANTAAASGDIAIVPKGSGGISAAVADGSSTGGNKRGSKAIDLQIARATAAQVASGSNSVLIGGTSSTASGNNSASVGGGSNSATGANAGILAGNGNIASGLYSSIAAGQTNTTSGTHSHVGGGQTNTATGNFSAIMGGSGNSALGSYAFIGGGQSNIASGDASGATGLNVTAESYGQFTVGRYNLPKGGESGSTWVTTDPLFVVGNGTGSGASRSTALMVLKSGSVGIGTTSPNASFAVSGDATIGKSTVANGGAKLDVAGAFVMSGSTSGYVGFQPSAVAGSTVWILPSSDGTSGQYLKTNGIGTLSWGTVSGTPGGATGQIQYNNAGAFGGSSAFYWDNTNSRLGVGTSLPKTDLFIHSTSTTGPQLTISTPGSTSSQQTMINLMTKGSTAVAPLSDTNTHGWQMYTNSYTAGSSQEDLAFSFWDGTSWNEPLHLMKTGNVGIGTTGPSQKLTVVGTVYSTSGGFKFPDGTVQTTAAGGGTVTNVTGTAPISVVSGTSTPGISITRATASVDGYLASSDFTTFSNKFTNNVSTNNRILGRSTVGSGTVEEITLGTGLSLSGGTVSIAVTPGEFTGTLPVSKGGTGASSLTGNGLLMSNFSGSTVTATTCSTAGQFLKWSGASWTCQTESAAGSADGQLQFYSSTNLAATTDLKWDISNHWLGVGNPSPTGVLDVQGGTATGSSNGTNITLRAQSGGTTGSTNGGNIYLIPGAKNSGGLPGTVSINSPSVSAMLGIQGQPNNLVVFYAENSGGNSLIHAHNSGAITLGATNGASNDRLTIQGMSTSSSNYSLVVKNSAPTTNFVVRDDGYVGIGTTSPGARLEIQGTAVSNPVIIAKGASGQTANLIEAKDYAGSTKFSVAASGDVQFSDASVQSSAASTPFLIYTGAQTLTGSTTKYTMVGNSTFSGTITNVAIPRGGIIRKLYVATGSTQAATGTLAVTVFKNGSATPVATIVGVSAGAGVFNSGAASAQVSAGDLISIAITNNASTTSASINSISFDMGY